MVIFSKNTPSLKATKIYKNQVVIFCFCSNEMQPCRIWGAKQKTESVAPRASTKLKKEQIALFFAFFLSHRQVLAVWYSNFAADLEKTQNYGRNNDVWFL